MNNVIYVKFPKKYKRKLPRQRVFYLGQYYVGPPLCQSLEKLWIKRKPNNSWIFQERVNGRVYQCEEYEGDDLLNALEGIPFVDEVTIDDLLSMGWYHRNAVINFNLAKLGVRNEP